MENRKKGNVGKDFIIGTSIGIELGVVMGATAGEVVEFPILVSAGTLVINGNVVCIVVDSISGNKRYYICCN